MAYQVGAFCYADAAAAAGAACAAHVPISSVTAAGVATLSCSGVVDGKMQMVSSFSALSPGSEPGALIGTCTGNWIQLAGGDGSSNGGIYAFGSSSDACAAFITFMAQYSATVTGCVASESTMHGYIDGGLFHFGRVGCLQGPATGASAPSGGTATQVTFETTPAFTDCQHPAIIEAGFTVALAIATAAVIPWAMWRIAKFLAWGRASDT